MNDIRMKCNPNKKYVALEFECDKCGKIQTTIYEKGWDDCLYYTCDCGAYYKKVCRIRDDSILRQTEFSIEDILNNNCREDI